MLSVVIKPSAFISLRSTHEILMIILPIFLRINILIILFYILLIFFKHKKTIIIKDIVKKPVFQLSLAFFLLSLLLVANAAPRTHRIFYDEDIYMDEALNIAELHLAQVSIDGRFESGEFKCPIREYGKEPSGYPFMLSICYSLFGTSHSAAFIYNNILFALSAILILNILIRLACGIPVAAIITFMYISTPINLKWFSTAAAEPSATFFPLLVFLCLIFYLEKPSKEKLYLLATLLSLTIQMRPESFLFVFVIGIMLALNWKKTNLRNSIKASSLFVILSIPLCIHILSTIGNNWGAYASPKFSFNYLLSNFSTNAIFYINNESFPVLLLFLAIIALFISKNRKFLIGLLSWFLLIFVIFLFFYAGSYEYGADDRFAILTIPPLAILAGLGLSTVLKNKAFKIYYKALLAVFIALALIQFIIFLPHIRHTTNEGRLSRADHQYILEHIGMLSDSSTVLTHTPSIYHLFGKNAAQAYLIENQNYMQQLFYDFPDGVYFWYGYWCVVKDPHQKDICNCYKNYKHKEILKYKHLHREFLLYKIEMESP